MTYSFLEISASKFSLNSRELFKTFIAIPVGNNSVKIVNIYDSYNVLMPTTLVSDIEVDNTTYNTSLDLINAIYSVIYSSSTSGSLDSQQIELNRLAIIDLQNNQTGTNHNHDERYYTQTEVDSKIQNTVSSSDLISKGDVDGDYIKFRNTDNTVIFSVDAKNFLAQGTIVVFENGKLKLKNSKGEELSSASIEAKESYYDELKFVSGIENDLSDLILTEKFELVKTNNGSHYFVSNNNNNETFFNSKIFINYLNLFFSLEEEDISTLNFKAWEINLDSTELIEGENYKYNFWNINTSSETKVEVFGNKWTLIKHPTNNNSLNRAILENNDFIVNGFFNNTTLWDKAQCLDASNKDLEASWTVFSSSEDLIIT